MQSREMMLAAAVLLVGCTQDQKTGGRKDVLDAAIPPTGIGLHQWSLLPGTTNATTTPVLMLWPLPSGVPVASLEAELQSNMVFASADGQDVVAASVLLLDGLGPQDSGVSDKQQPPPAYTGGYVLEVVPVVALRADTWYELRWPATTDIVIAADDSYDLGVGVLTRFYTGSAPQLRKLDVLREEGAPGQSLIVQMSEPMNLQDLVSGGVVITASTPLSGNCIIGTTNCSQVASDGATTTVLEYQFTGDIPTSFEIALALSVRGVAKTVGEAVGESAVRGATTVNDEFLLYEMDLTTWRQRHNPGELGWSNAE